MGVLCECDVRLLPSQRSCERFATTVSRRIRGRPPSGWPRDERPAHPGRWPDADRPPRPSPWRRGRRVRGRARRQGTAVIVVGVDGTAGATAALEFALAEGRKRGCPVEVVTAWLGSGHLDGTSDSDDLAQARARVHRHAGRRAGPLSGGAPRRPRGGARRRPRLRRPGAGRAGRAGLDGGGGQRQPEERPPPAPGVGGGVLRPACAGPGRDRAGHRPGSNAARRSRSRRSEHGSTRCHARARLAAGLGSGAWRRTGTSRKAGFGRCWRPVAPSSATSTSTSSSVRSCAGSWLPRSSSSPRSTASWRWRPRTARWSSTSVSGRAATTSTRPIGAVEDTRGVPASAYRCECEARRSATSRCRAVATSRSPARTRSCWGCSPPPRASRSPTPGSSRRAGSGRSGSPPPPR